jgi:hypothetical protein
MGRIPRNSLIADSITKRIRELITSRKGSKSMDLEVARILGITRSVAGRKLRGAAGWKSNQVRDIAAAYGVPSSILLDAKPNPNLLRIDKNVRPERLTPLSIPVYQESSGESIRTKAGGTLNLPRDSATIRVDTSDLAPAILQGQYAIISREEKPRHGDAVYVQRKGGGHDFGVLVLAASRLMLMKGNNAPVPIRRGDVTIYTIVGHLRK